MELACTVADAFTADYDEALDIHRYLRTVFGKYIFKRYAVDQSSTIYAVTFSERVKPKLYYYQGMAAIIASSDASPFLLNIQLIDVMRPGRSMLARTHTHYIGDAPPSDG
jgi:hypothetical protein